MPELPLILSFAFGSLFLAVVGALAIFSVVHAKNRIIREHRRALELEQRQRKAQQAFMDNAHHELKTPLQIILGNLYLLRTLELDKPHEKALARAETATLQLQNLVSSLLEFTALQQGTLVLHPEMMDLGPHLQALISEFESPARAKELDYRVDVDSASCLVMCDWPRLRRVLGALLENALRFTETGAISIKAKVNPNVDPCLLRFEVADTGIGLPADWQHLLQPFVQDTSAPHRIPEGLGLGLPMAKGLVGQMGGSLGLSPLATGTLTWVEVSLPKADLRH